MRIILIAFLFTSCVSLKSKMNAYVGQDKDAVIQSYGLPEQTTSDGHTGQIIAYSRRMYESNQYGSADKYRITMFFIDRHDKVYHWIVREEPNPPARLDLRVYAY